MPYFNGTTEDTTSVSATWKSAGGDIGSVNIPSQETITKAEVAAAIQDISEVTNAGLVKNSLNIRTGLVSNTTLIAYDEAHSSASMKLVLIYENTTTGERTSVPVPAPDQAMFLGDGVTPNPANADFIKLEAAVSTILNGGAAGVTQWTLVTAYRADYAQKLRKPREGEVAVEPSPAGPPA